MRTDSHIGASPSNLSDAEHLYTIEKSFKSALLLFIAPEHSLPQTSIAITIHVYSEHAKPHSHLLMMRIPIRGTLPHCNSCASQCWCWPLRLNPAALSRLIKQLTRA